MNNSVGFDAEEFREQKEHAARMQLYYELVIREASNSLLAFLANTVIDRRPKPLRWDRCIEQWQQWLIQNLAPAIEQACGLRHDYTGPRWFFITMPRGHDKTGLFGRILNFACGFSRYKVQCIGAATDVDQAKKILSACRRQAELNPWHGVKCKDTGGIAAVSGPCGQVDIITSDAASATGDTTDIFVLDEVGQWKKQDLWNALVSGAGKRPTSVIIVITNAGILDTWQHEALLKAKKSKRWFVFECPERMRLAQWMSQEDYDAIRETIAPGYAKRMLDNIWVAGGEMPLIEKEEWLDQCAHPKTLWHARNNPQPKNWMTAPEFYVGFDIGRGGQNRDKAVISVLQNVGDTAWLRILRELGSMPLAQQKAELKSILAQLGGRKYVINCNIDQGTLGYQLAEEMAAETNGLCQPYSLSAKRQGAMALRMLSRLQSGRMRLPCDPENPERVEKTLRADFLQVQRVENGAGGIPEIKTERSGIGHADRFWSIALAELAMPEVEEPILPHARTIKPKIPSQIVRP